MQPAITSVNHIGQMEGFTHQASLILLDEKLDVKNLIKELNEYFIVQPDIIFGITSAQQNGIILRILGQKAEQLFTCLKKVAELYPIFPSCKLKWKF